jgi:anti-anti-sigma factor
MNDPRYIDASRDVKDMLDQGYKNFILELGGVRETGSAFLGVLMTISRQIRKQGGDAVLAHLSPDMVEFIDMMQMDTYWDIFDNVAEAKGFFHRP